MATPRSADRVQALARRIWRRAASDRPLPSIRIRDVRRGRWSDKTGIITLPSWLWARHSPGFVEYYIAHELAHAYLNRTGHDIEFQLICAKLAEETYWWESTYKPRMYAACLSVLSRPSVV